MKELLIGMIFLTFAAVFAGVGFLLLPLLLAMVVFLRVIFISILFFVAAWFLGRLIIYMWQRINKGKIEKR